MIDRTELHAYVDGQLDAAASARVQAAIAEDPSLGAEIQSIEGIKRLLETTAPRITCDETWSKCVRRLDELDKARRVEGFVGRYAWAMCGFVFLSLLVGGVASRSSAPQSQGAELARMVTSLAPVAAPRNPLAAERGQWLDGVLGQARRSIDPDRMNITAAAQGVVDGQRIARLSLRDAEGDMAFVAIEGRLPIGIGEERTPDGYRLGKLGEANIVVWDAPGYTLVLCGERSHEDLRDVVGRICPKRRR